jgi:hypothetical protein
MYRRMIAVCGAQVVSGLAACAADRMTASAVGQKPSVFRSMMVAALALKWVGCVDSWP